MKAEYSGIEHIGTRLRMVRQEKGLTQDKLAHRASTNPFLLQKIEHGKSLRPADIMDIAEALDVNPAWLQFGEPYARRPWPDEVPKKPRLAEHPDFVPLLRLADELISRASNDQLAETARLLAMNLAHYQIRFGEIPLENFETLMETQSMDDETARLVAVSMENLVGVLGLVTTQDEAANDHMH